MCLRVCLSVCVWESVVITSGPSTRLRPAFTVYNRLDQSRLSVQPVSGPGVRSYINYRQAVRVCVCDSVFSPSIILNRTRPEVVLLSKHFWLQGFSRTGKFKGGAKYLPLKDEDWIYRLWVCFKFMMSLKKTKTSLFTWWSKWVPCYITFCQEVLQNVNSCHVKKSQFNVIFKCELNQNAHTYMQGLISMRLAIHLNHNFTIFSNPNPLRCTFSKKTKTVAVCLDSYVVEEI